MTTTEAENLVWPKPDIQYQIPTQGFSTKKHYLCPCFTVLASFLPHFPLPPTFFPFFQRKKIRKVEINMQTSLYLQPKGTCYILGDLLQITLFSTRKSKTAKKAHSHFL